MSDEATEKKLKTTRKKSDSTKNLVDDFINKKSDSDEPKAKKLKKAPSVDSDDSFKFFKSLKPCNARSQQKPGTSSNLATTFINESSSKPPAVKSKSKPAVKPTKRKPKAQSDIRKVLSKQEQIFNYAVTENCLAEGIDPEEMQIALAISESLKDQTKLQADEASTSSAGKFDNPFSSMGKVQSISAALEQFGFKCKKNYTEYEIDLITNSKFSKRSKFQKFPTALTRTSNEKRSEIIRKKIDIVLDKNSSQGSSELNAGTRHGYEVFSFYLQDFFEQNRTVFMISSETRPADETFLNYYVTELFEPSFVEAGHLLKDWRKIPGRDATPERELKSSESVSIKRNDCDANDVQVFDDEAEDAKATSCLDIFADLDDFEFEENDSEAPESDAKETSVELAGHLSVLQEKMSQSMTEVDDNEANEKQVLKMKLNSTIIEPVEEDTSGLIEFDKVDLTQGDSSINSSAETIPYDDSYYSLQQHMKKLEGVAESPLAAIKTHNNDKTSTELSVIDLLSSEDEREEPVASVEKLAENFLEDESDNEQLLMSLNSLDDDELIAISDEEINYSIRKFHNNNENPSDESLEDDGAMREIVDLTQEIIEPEVVDIQIEVDRHLDQSLVDVMDQQNAFDINDSILNLLESSSSNPNLNVSKRDRSIKFMESNGLSDSIQEILRKYGGETSNEKENSRSLKKMQSDSCLVGESFKARKSVRFSIDEDCNVFDLTQPTEADEFKENSFQFNKSIHQSIENIVNASPAVKRTKVQRQMKLNFKAKKSLGVQLDDDYFVDTDSIIPEPDYKNMTPVELKQALFKIGVRSLPVKKAVKLLEFIYDQLHPTIRVAADEEIDANDSRREMNITDIVTNIGVQDDDEFVFQLGLIDDEDFILPKMRKSKNPVCALPLHIAFYNMVRSNEKIQKFILEFRPIELDQLHKHFRKFGLSYQPNDIIAFLDRRCITFKTKDQSYSKTHEKKKQKKAQKSQSQK